jgi:ferredoxin
MPMASDPLNVEVTIDRDRCIGSQNCVHHLPSMFQIDDEGLAVTVPHGYVSLVLLDMAVHDCPTEAIKYRPSAAPE